MENKRMNNGNMWLGEPTKAKASGLAFSLASVLPSVFAIVMLAVLWIAGVTVTDDALLPDWYVYLNFLLPQAAFGVTVWLFLRYRNIPLRQAVSKQKCKVKYFAIALLLQIGLLCLSELNAWFLQFLGKFGYQDAGITLPSMDGFGFVGVLVCVAVLPALMEEIFFRGVLLSGLQSFGKWGGILLCGVLFSLYHQNPAQTLYQFCCGVAFALVAVRAGSILPTILAHFFNNALIIILFKCGVTSFNGTWLAIELCVSILCLIVALVWLFVFDKEKQEKQEKREKQVAETDKTERKHFLVAAALGIAVCALSWFAMLIGGL
jgi:membrane protease YdiL (CAAX protease family)